MTLFRHIFKQMSGMEPVLGRLEPVKKKDDKGVMVKYVNRLFSCNQHFQLLLSITSRNAWKYFKVIWKSRGILFSLSCGNCVSVDNRLNKWKHISRRQRSVVVESDLLWLCQHSWSSIQVSLGRPLPKPRGVSTNQSRRCLLRRCLTMGHFWSRTLLWTSLARSSQHSTRCFLTQRKSVISRLSRLLVLLLVETENTSVWGQLNKLVME